LAKIGVARAKPKNAQDLAAFFVEGTNPNRHITARTLMVTVLIASMPTDLFPGRIRATQSHQRL
jgi:hypothetical protein